MGLPERNGVVPHEDERHGALEVRRAAKAIRLRKPQTVPDHREHEARAGAVFLALAAARPRLSGTGARRRGPGTTVGSEPAEIS